MSKFGKDKILVHHLRSTSKFALSVMAIFLVFLIVGLLWIEISESSRKEYYSSFLTFLILITATKVFLSYIFNKVTVDTQQKVIILHYTFFKKKISLDQIKKWGVRSIEIGRTFYLHSLEIKLKSSEVISYPLSIYELSPDTRKHDERFSHYLGIEPMKLKKTFEWRLLAPGKMWKFYLL